MKRIFKNKRQKGFTLLETLLSVAIMVIISTMLLNGFAATMGYSYHTSVYTKSAASNYSSCMGTLAALHDNSAGYTAPTGGATPGMSKNNYFYSGGVALGKVSYGGASQTSKVTIQFKTSPGVTTNAAGADMLNDLNAAEFAYTNIPTGIDVGGIIENNTVSANRKTFFYYPTVNYDPAKLSAAGSDETKLLNDAFLGHINIYKLNKAAYGGTSGQYIWGYMSTPNDPSTFVAIGTPFSMTA